MTPDLSSHQTVKRLRFLPSGDLARLAYMRFVAALIFQTIALLLSGPQAAITEVEHGELADALGLVSAWRMIPGQLLERCAGESANAAERQKVFEYWELTNRSLISLIEETVQSSSNVYAELLQISQKDAQTKILEATKFMIEENYFNNERITPAPICADYEKIVTDLSRPGRASATRGRVYQIEMPLFKPNRRLPATPNNSFKADAIPTRP